ncbi:MAG: hypothetical protein ACYC55_10480 [Candidatus Geothermincolia bacterium]
MGLMFNEEKMRQTVAGYLEPGEGVHAMGWASEKGVKYFYVVLTESRLLLIRLNMSYKPKGADSIPLGQLAAWSLEEGFKVAPIDMQILSRMAETSLYFKTTDGKKRALRFANIMGYANKEIPVRMVEMLNQMRAA